MIRLCCQANTSRALLFCSIASYKQYCLFFRSQALVLQLKRMNNTSAFHFKSLAKRLIQEIIERV